jgi:hypothetical protein
MNQTAHEIGTVELVKGATRDVRDLAKLELALAKDELLSDLAAAKATAILGGSAFVIGILGLSSLVAAIAVALGPFVGVVLGLLLLVTGTGLAVLAYKFLPKKPLRSTARRLELDEQILKEHLS